jgi:hypothetical protein
LPIGLVAGACNQKVRALDGLAKHFGLLVERIEHSGSVDLVHRLEAARQRGKPVPAIPVEATPVEESRVMREARPE